MTHELDKWKSEAGYLPPGTPVIINHPKMYNRGTVVECTRTGDFRAPYKFRIRLELSGHPEKIVVVSCNFVHKF